METRETIRPIVLLVDDTSEYSNEFFRAFVEAGYKVEASASFKAALEIIHKHGSNDFVVFVDIFSLKVLAKQAFVTYIRNQLSHRVVIFAWVEDSGSQSGNDNLRCIGADVGVSNIFFKGVSSFKVLLAHIQRYQNFLQFRNTDERDFLTGLKNRRAFTREVMEELGKARTRGKPEKFSLIMIDVDHFKVVNDTHGHLIGDEALMAVGQVITDEIRVYDLSCRYGGDEFLIFIVDMDMEKAREVGEKLQRAVEIKEVPDKDGKPLKLSISFGVGEMSAEEVSVVVKDSLNELIERAELGPHGLHVFRKHRRT